jgi:3-hydroxybutyryl-CoA dehydrogenase
MVWKCEKCNREWHYPIEKCIFCGGNLNSIPVTSFTVKGITEIFVPSVEHDSVPYYALLLEDDRGNLHIKKSFEKYSIGDLIESESSEEEQLKTIGVVGTGIMGKGITQFFAQAGYSVVLYGRTEDGASKAVKEIEKSLLKIINPQEKENILDRIEPTIDMSKLADADLIIESVIEDINIKKQLFKDLSVVCSQHTIFTTNTSSLSITELSTSVSNPGRFVGMHFFNPVSKMHLVEIVDGADTSEQTVEYVTDLLKKLGKTPIVVKDSPGFIVNRILMPLLNEAAFLYQEGVNPTDIDTAIKLGLNHPMGPLALADLIGLDTCVSIMSTLNEKFNDEKYVPSPIFYKMIGEGHLGKKTGKGFYEYKN